MTLLEKPITTNWILTIIINNLKADAKGHREV